MQTTQTRLLALGTLVAFLVLGAAAARADAVSELESRTQTLIADYQDIQARIDSCPDGSCSDRTSIEADEATLSAELADLQAEREDVPAELDTAELDDLLADAAAAADLADRTIKDWPEL